MTPLRAYLMLRSGDSEWSVSVCRDLETVIQVWRERSDPDVATGILHVGFDRPPSQLFSDVAKSYPGRMLVTASAKYALPRSFQCSERHIGKVEGHLIYIATGGWGYTYVEEVDPDVQAEENSPEHQHATRELRDWLESFVAQYPNFELALRENDILDEESYIKNEALLDREARYRAGLYRYQTLVGTRSDDPREVLYAAPPWLLDRTLDSMELPVRVKNVFVNLGAKTVRDLLGFTIDDLLHLPNFGKRSVGDWRDALLQALNEGPFDIHAKLSEASAESLISEIERTLSPFDERERDILVRRMGLNRNQQTLQQIADDYNITRERVRQIEAKSIRRLTHTAYWDDLLVKKIETLLLGRDFPLPVLGLEALDRWFWGVGKSRGLLKFLLGNVAPDRIEVVRIDGVEYVGRLSADDWDATLFEARRLLAGAGSGWSEAHCRAVVQGLLKESVREFRPLLWQHASRLCHFVDGPDGSRVLASYGRGVEQAVEAVLSEADAPLHFSMIAERAAQRIGKPVDIRRAHNAAAAVGLLMGRGTYGLEKHLKLTEQDGDAIREMAEQTILTGADGRQWHASELASIVAECDFPNIGVVDKYTIDILLRQSDTVRALGRMTWAKAQPDIQGANNRIDLRQAIISVLQQAGAPLTTGEIRQRLVALRGLNEHFQISPVLPLIRVGSGLWGLADRDVPLTTKDQQALIRNVVDALRTSNEGIHLSEIPHIVGSTTPCQLDPTLIFSLVTQDPRLTVNSGQYIFLKEWGSARREGVANAVRMTLEHASSPLTIDEIVKNVQARVKRACEKSRVSSCLQAIEATFDPVTGTWTYSPSGEEYEDLPEANVA